MSRQANIRVLHVDDNPDFAELTAEFLKREDDSFTVKTATSASEGLEHLSHDDFDCIVSDYDMPGQNGIDFLKSVRKKAPNLPFVLFTGKGSEEIASEAISADVTDYLQKKRKTDQFTVLANRLRNAVRQHRAEKDRKRQRKAIETAQEGISILNEDGEFIYVNQAYADMYGYEPGEMNGEHWELIYPDDETAIVQDVIFPTVAEDGYWSGNTTGLRADGTTFLEDHTVTQTDTGELICSVRDRSVKQEAELEMQSAAMEAAMDGISILNGDGEYIYMNQAHADVFEYDADELLGSTWHRLYGDDEIARIEQDIFPVIEREGEWRGETVGKRRDGSPVHQEITLSLLDDGKLICTNRDITERREREQELQMVREQFDQFAGNVQDAFFLLPTDYSETKYVNPAVETIYGISPEEAYDDPTAWLRHVHTNDKDELLKSLEAQQDGTVEWPIEQEFRVNHPSGARWVQARLDVITNENGDPFRLAGVTTDITRRIERKQQLEQQTEELEHLASKYESQYQTLFEEAPVMTVLTRSEDDRPIIEDYNSQFVETLGYDADIIIGSELTEFYTPESEEKLQSGGYSRSINGQFTREKRDLVADDGEVVEALLRSVPRRTADGEVIGTVAMYIDITERESVKRINKRLEEFTSVVSHDLRNPLQIATGGLEMASIECDSDYLDEAKKGLNRMETLIDDLLMLAREGKEVTDAQPVNLDTMISSCWETVDTGQAALSTNTERSILADKSRLKQVFENLFRNAIEHGGPDVTVTVGELEEGFYIEDDGPGVPSDEYDNIFEAGYSQSADGTGFGLSIVEQIVTAHDWQISVTDGSDGGARFEISDVGFVLT